MKKINLILLVGVAACGSDDKSEGGDFSELFPSGFAVSNFFNSASSGNARFGSVLQEGDFNSGANFEEKVAVYEEIVSGDSLDACGIKLPQLMNPSGPECYGPMLNVSGHVDGGDTTDTLPGGDLGIWSSTEGSEACAASKVNSLNEGVSIKVDQAMLLSAAMVCVLNNSGEAVPGVGSSVDATDALSTALSKSNPNETLKSAKIERLDDQDGAEVFQYSIESSENNVAKYFYMKIKKSDSAMSGKIWGAAEGLSSGQSGSTAFSVIFEKSGSDVKYMAKSGDYNKASLTVENLFTDGELTFQTGFGGNLNKMVSNLNTDTKVGNLAFAWQAGTDDGYARVFNAFTENGAALTGCGFFGFGEKFDISAKTDSDSEISRFICSWKHNQSNKGDDTIGMAQKQCMTYSETNKVFEVSSENITYAPVNSCSVVANSGMQWEIADGMNDQTVSGSPDFDGTAVLNDDLITLSSDSDFAKYSAPTAPTDF